MGGERVARGQGTLEGVGQSRLAHPRFPKQHNDLPLPWQGARPETADSSRSRSRPSNGDQCRCKEAISRDTPGVTPVPGVHMHRLSHLW